MKLTYDEQADAAYVEVSGPIAPGGVDYTEEMDQDRNIDRDAEDAVLGYEFLNAKRHGVRLDDLEHRQELSALFRDAGFQERDWSSQRSSPHDRERATG